MLQRSLIRLARITSQVTQLPVTKQIGVGRLALAATAGAAAGAYLLVESDSVKRAYAMETKTIKDETAPRPGDQPSKELYQKAVVEDRKPLLNPDQFQDFVLVHTEQVTSNTKLFRFAPPGVDTASKNKGEWYLNMPIASCILVQAEIDGKVEVRPYTPITRPGEGTNYFDLVIKVYLDGKMSKHIHGLKLGDKLLVKGPIAKYPYQASKLREVAILSGGTCITPALQLIEEILENPQDKTRVTLVFGNQTPSDIILRETLDRYAQRYPQRFKLVYTVDRGDAKWKGHVGYIDKELLQSVLPKPASAEDTSFLIAVCGPPPMMKSLSGEKESPKAQGPLSGMLKDMGYTEKQVFKF